MSGKGLPVIEERILSKREQFEEETRIRCEQQWMEKNASSVLESERINRISGFLSKLDLQGKAVADLGCGSAPYLLEGSSVTAVDIVQTALDKCPGHVKRIRGCLPYVRLPEESFDCVLLADVIAEIEPHLYRLLLSEASHLMKREAFFVCSSELDFTSEDPLGHLLSLLKTEFQIVDTRKSCHRLYIYLRRCLDAPSRFVRASKDQPYRLSQIEKRRGLLRFWFYANSLKWVSLCWQPLVPLKKCLHNRRLLLFLEKLSEILWGEGGLSHVIVLCKRKSLHPHQ